MKDAAIIQAEISLNRENGYEGGEERAAGAEKARVSDGGATRVWPPKGTQLIGLRGNPGHP